MNEKSLADIVKQLEGEPRESDYSASDPDTLPDDMESESSLRKWLAATEWTLDDLRDRYCQLEYYREELLARLDLLGADDPIRNGALVPGPFTLQ